VAGGLARGSAGLFEKAVAKFFRRAPEQEGLSAYRSISQSVPGGKSGPPISFNQLRNELGQTGLWHHVKDYDLVHEPAIAGPPGRKIYGNSPYNVDGTPKLGPNGRPKIEFSDDGLSDMEQAVRTAMHESWHQRNLAARGVPGIESEAVKYEEQMYQVYLSRKRGREL
jgi:hypothetical protein